MDIFDYIKSYGGPEVFMLLMLILITPLFYILFLKKFKLKAKIFGIVVVLLLSALLAYTDVVLIAQESKKLCEQDAGLHIYKKEPSDSFVGATDIEYWQQYGFSFLEYETATGERTKYTFENGKAVYINVEELKSLHEVATESYVIGSTITRNRKFVRNRETGQILGEVIYFHLYPGWLDRVLIGALGFSWTAPICDGKGPPGLGKSTYVNIQNLILKTLRPTKGS